MDSSSDEEDILTVAAMAALAGFVQEKEKVNIFLDYITGFAEILNK